MVPPIAEQLSLPSSYGSPDRLLDWLSVEQRLVDSPHYWLATVRRNGAPHVVPVDGIWLDGGCYFGGDPETVQPAPRSTRHAAPGGRGIGGHCRWHRRVDDAIENVAQRLVRASTAKYGYSQSAASYLAGAWRLQPVKVLAWTMLYVDATRFHFEAAV